MDIPPTNSGPKRCMRPALVAAALAVLTGWVVFLRWPTLGVPLWNVDEAIHATIARTLLDGGVLYRDAVDQRTPLTYYAVAALFRVFGENNLWAVRAAVAGMIGLTALGIGLLGLRAQSRAAGAWSAVVFCALSTNLLYPADNFSANTEWFVILFTTAGTWWFWVTLDRNDFLSPAITGALFGLAALSKQPALFDLAAPLLTAGYLAATGHRSGHEAFRKMAGVLLGFVGVNAVSCAWFAWHGAFGDMVFYTCAYNLIYYGADITGIKRLEMAIVPFDRLAMSYPLVLGALVAGFAVHLVRVAQRRAPPPEKAAQPWAFYLVVWNVTSLAAAASSGRMFEHYYIQCLPAFSLAAGSLLAGAGSMAGARWRRAPRRPADVLGAVAIAGFLGLTGLTVVVSPLATRGRAEYPHDPGIRVAAFVKKLTRPAERIFAWGYNADFYLYTDRQPASRFSYCSFQTGLIPWTNLQPGRDTSATIVPDAMPILLRELDARRPAFFIDCSAGPHRNFSKYPLSKFPLLESFVARNYALVEAGQFVPQGFRVHLIRDAARRQPARLDGGPRGSPAAPDLLLSSQAGPVPTGVVLVGRDPDGRLQKLELLVDDVVVDSVSFQPTPGLSVELTAPFNRLGPGRYRLLARATSANGRSRDSPVLNVTCAAAAVSKDRIPAFFLPCVTNRVVPLILRSPFNPLVDDEKGHRSIFMHAPSMLSYPLPAEVRRLHGGFGFRDGAYAATNPSPTDGAEFKVELVSAGGERHTLLSQLLQPRDHPDDRPVHPFSLELPPHGAGASVEFIITPGPADNAASDWTYWTDLEADSFR